MGNAGKGTSPDSNQHNQFEERVLNYQQELESKNALQLEEQLNQYKEIELSRLRLDERKKYKSELDNQKQYYEKRLIEMETKNLQALDDERERVLKRENELERINMELKQQVLNETNKALMIEKKAKSDSEMHTRELEFERDQLSKKYASLQTQLDDINEFKERYTLKMEEAIAKYLLFDIEARWISITNTQQCWQRLTQRNENYKVND